MIKIKKLTQMALMCAFLAVMSQIVIPTPWGIPFTMQVFGVALAGFIFEPLQSVISVFIYILLGIIGIPVFSGFRGGVSELISPTGGFLFGFLALAFFCSLAQKSESLFCKIVCYIIGFCLCHAVGCVQFAIVCETTILSAFIVASLPYIFKDILCILSAHAVSIRIKRALISKR